MLAIFAPSPLQEDKSFFSWKRRDYDRSLVRRKSWYGRPDQKMPITCWKPGLPRQEVVSPRGLFNGSQTPPVSSIVSSPPRTPITANIKTFSASKFSLLLASLISHGVLWQNDIILEPLKTIHKGWLAIAKLKPLSLFISILLMLKKALDNVKIEK